MQARRLMWLFIILAILSLSFVAAAAMPKDYHVRYEFKNPDGSIFRIVDYYMRDGVKFRYIYSNTDGSTYFNEVYRKDKMLIWSLEPDFKQYIEVKLKPEDWLHVMNNVTMSPADLAQAKKNGQAKLLGYNCDIYETEVNIGQIYQNTVYQAQDTQIILKAEMKKDGKQVQLMTATKFELVKPDAALFEVPAGFAKGTPNN
jgi:hypothetical protein